MHTNQLSLHIKNSQKQLTTSKTLETKVSKGVDRVRNFKVKSTTNAYKRFGSTKNEVCGTPCVKKLCVYR